MLCIIPQRANISCPQNMLATGVVAIFIIFLLYNICRKKSSKYPPQPPGAWPIIGHLPLLGSGRVHLAHPLAKLAENYGPVFSLWLGMQRVVFVSSREAVAECFTTNDKSFIDRPHRSSTAEYLAYNFTSFGFSNGPYWREMRKFVTSEVLSSPRLEAMKNLRVSEIATSIGELYFDHVGTGLLSSKVVLNEWVDRVTLNIIVKTIAGKRYGNSARTAENGEVGRFRKLIKEFTFLAGEFILYDVIPFRLLKWMDPQGHIRAMKRVSKELDVIVEEWIEEHVIKKERMGEIVKEEQDFLDVMLETIKDNFFDSTIKAPPPRIQIKATVVNVILGGFDTTSVYLTWLLSLLVNHKHVLKTAQQEIDDLIGKKRWMQESDMKILPYLQAIIKEALRLYPPLPLSLPHQAIEDCRLHGYDIPKGTLLFVNLRKLHRDPQYWPEPEKFMPERFLTSHAHIDVLGKNFELTPFGAGRRSCPGTTFAMHVTGLIVGRLIQGFDMWPVGESVDMKEGIAITMPRQNPLEVLITPRLPSHLYVPSVS